MMKMAKELNELKEEAGTVSKKHHELTDEKLEQVSGGITHAGSLRKVRMDFSVDGQEYGEQHITN